MKIDFTEASTKRGFVWLIAALIAIPLMLTGKDIQPILTLAAAVSGGLGIVLKG